MDDIKAKQQVVEKIKEASKILVTVSKSPSVDALSAALGLTMLFDKQEKYATAIFSGEVPPAIAFLEPEKTFDETTDSLRDFIIALNKEKADHLRYKVEGDSVKIFITPYKTVISKDDLEFSQGDYNVELVIALGVESQDQLDKAMEDHGQILHDATVITVSAGDQTSDLGGIDWHDANASSLSEMISGLAEALKEDKKKPLIDASIATALLTGIVAQTDRFSNENTTSKAMTVAAQLMTAGADQQLIATKLEAAAPIEEILEEPTVEEPAKEEPEEIEDINEVAEDGSLGNITIKKDELNIEHDDTETLAELDRRVREKPQEIIEEPQEVVREEPEYVAEEQAEESETSAFEPIETPRTAYMSTPQVPPTPAVEAPRSEDISSLYAIDDENAAPSLGGTLNATSEQAAEDSRREALSSQNKTILSHAYLGGQTDQVSSTVGASPVGFPGTPPVAPGSVGINSIPDDEVHSAYALGDHSDQSNTSAENSAPSFGVGGGRVIAPLSDPAPPVELGLPLPPPLPDFSQGPAMPPAFPPIAPPTFPSASAYGVTPEATTQTEILGDILAPDPTSAYSFENTPPPTTSNDPGQFKIPT